MMLAARREESHELLALRIQALDFLLQVPGVATLVATLFFRLEMVLSMHLSLRWGQRSSPCFLHILFIAVDPMPRAFAAVSMGRWKHVAIFLMSKSFFPLCSGPSSRRTLALMSADPLPTPGSSAIPVRGVAR